MIDAAPLAQRIAAHLTANPEFVNLPRKFKICVTGCPEWCSYPEINDIGLTGVERFVDGRREVGYNVRVGGGLSKDPHLAIRLNAFIKPEQAEEVCYKINRNLPRSAGHAARKPPRHARLKFMFMKDGWTAETFLAELERKLGYKLDPAPEEIVPDDLFRDHTGVLAAAAGGPVVRRHLSAARAPECRSAARAC